MNKIIKTIYLAGWSLAFTILAVIAVIITIIFLIIKVLFLILPIVIIAITLVLIYYYSKRTLSKYFTRKGPKRKDSKTIEVKFKIK